MNVHIKPYRWIWVSDIAFKSHKLASLVLREIILDNIRQITWVLARHGYVLVMQTPVVPIMDEHAR